METLHQIKGKIEQNKELKKRKLLEAADSFFSTKGFHKTSIQDIVNAAGVAKGTFYLYFKNKEDIRESLILEKAQTIIVTATEATINANLSSFQDQVIFMINYIIDTLSDNHFLLRFFNRDLTIGYYSQEFSKIFNNAYGIQEFFKSGLKSQGFTEQDTDVIFFMIVELVSTTTYRCMTEGVPCDIDTYKPYLYQTIRYLMTPH